MNARKNDEFIDCVNEINAVRPEALRWFCGMHDLNSTYTHSVCNYISLAPLARLHKKQIDQCKQKFNLEHRMRWSNIKCDINREKGRN
jgi:hypothetical protein